MKIWFIQFLKIERVKSDLTRSFTRHASRALSSMVLSDISAKSIKNSSENATKSLLQKILVALHDRFKSSHIVGGMFPRVFGDEFGDKFGDEFGDKFSELPNLVIILVMNLVMNLVNCQIR